MQISQTLNEYLLAINQVLVFDINGKEESHTLGEWIAIGRDFASEHGYDLTINFYYDGATDMNMLETSSFFGNIDVTEFIDTTAPFGHGITNIPNFIYDIIDMMQNPLSI